MTEWVMGSLRQGRKPATDDAARDFDPDEKGRLKSLGIRVPDPSKSRGTSGCRTQVALAT